VDGKKNKRKNVVIAGSYLYRITETGESRIIVKKLLVEKQAKQPAKKNG